MTSQSIAVVGSGIAGLACAWRLARHHQVCLYEANDYLGGHTHTVVATVDGVSHPVDTGFLVFNHRTYPQLTRLFAELGVATTPTDMSFSARIDGAGLAGRNLEWAGTNLASVFAQARNLGSPRFLRMLAELLRFNRLATQRARAAAPGDATLTLGAFLDAERFGPELRDWYLLPMAAAIWSCPTRQMLEFPLASFLAFCANHGLLQVADRPQWHTVTGGAARYVDKLVATLPEVRRGEPVLEVRRAAGRVALRSARATRWFDQVVLACHADQALGLLADPTPAERALLAAVRYQRNRAVLHTDASVLPRSRRAWAAWNYQSAPDRADPDTRAVCVHYLINRLQPVPFTRPVLVSLNPVTPLDERAVLAGFDYAHPVFDAAAVAAQARLVALQGGRNTWYCGAWTGHGFHEDGLRSGLAVAAALTTRAATPLAA